MSLYLRPYHLTSLPFFLLAASGCGNHERDTPIDASSQAATVDATSWSALDRVSRSDRAPVDVFYVALSEPPAIEVVAPAERSTASGVARLREQRDRTRVQRDAVRPRILSRGLAIDGELENLTNAFVVRGDPSIVRSLMQEPEVLRVERALYVTPSLQSALGVIGAPAVWQSGTSLTGQGVTVGIIDSGVDYTHADFGGSGNPDDHLNNDPTIVEPASFPTARVVAGHDFVGDDYDPGGGSPSPQPDEDPLDCFHPQSMQVTGGHGTHVAGIAGGGGVLLNGTPFTGPYNQSFEPFAFRVAPGVAPESDLVAMKIFGCNGGSTALAMALDYAVDPNDDGDLSDRLDVVNASLGSAYGTSSQTSSQMAGNLELAGTVFVVAAGNDGPSTFAVGSPAIAPEALAVAASADTDFLALSVDQPQSIQQEMAAAEAGFTIRLTDTGPITGTLVYSSPADGCSSFSNAAEIAGNIAFIDRGECFFVEKFGNAVDAGAVAVVVVDNEYDSAPFAMGGGDPNEIPIPGVMIRRVDGELIKTELGSGVVVTLDGTSKFEGLGAELFAPFSSRGPSIDGLLKPDVAAPGFSIDSAQVGSGTEPRRSQGTSMAAPFAAGAAALVRQQNPDFEPLHVRAAMMNTAATVADLDGNPYTVPLFGAGRIDVERATSSRAVVRAKRDDGAIGISLGGHVIDEPLEVSGTAVVENLGNAAVTYDVSAAATYPLPGVALEMSPSRITVPAGESAEVELTLFVDPAELGAPPPDPVTPIQQFENPRHYLSEASGHVIFDDGESALRLPFYAALRAAAEREVEYPGTCVPLSEGKLDLEIGGTSAHPEPVLTAFELGALDPEEELSEDVPEVAQTDILAVGAMSDYATAETWEDVTVMFGVHVKADWWTPAEGPISRVGVLIDRSLNGSADFVVFAEALTREGPYADVLAATAYSLTTGQELESKRYLNMVSRESYDSAPFLNNVVVLPVTISALLVGEGDTFRYRAITQSDSFFGGDESPWVTYDPTRLVIDTARYAPIEGRPIYGGSDPFSIHVDPSKLDDDEELPDLMVLHHSNVTGSRLDLVDLDAQASGNLKLTKGTTNIADDGTVRSEIEVENNGSEPLIDVKVSIEADGLDDFELDATSGDCNATSCSFEGIAGDDTITIGVVGTLSEDEESFSIVANAEVEDGCDDEDDDNTLEITGELDSETPLDDDGATLVPSGGCACDVAATRSSSGLPALGLGALALLWGYRRRRQRG